MTESLIAEPKGDVERSRSVVAEDYDRSIRIKFGVGAGGDVAHRHEERVWDAGGLVFPGFANVEKEGRVG